MAGTMQVQRGSGSRAAAPNYRYAELCIHPAVDTTGPMAASRLLGRLFGRFELGGGAREKISDRLFAEKRTPVGLGRERDGSGVGELDLVFEVADAVLHDQTPDGGDHGAGSPSLTDPAGSGSSRCT